MIAIANQGEPGAGEGDSYDVEEVREWQEAFESVFAHAGPEQARRILDTMVSTSRTLSLDWRPPTCTPYVNTVPPERQPPFPGDLQIEKRLASIMRWNALAMVARANRAFGELGGHIASYASAADLFEVGFNHFFRGHAEASGPDLVFYQPHSAPGIYARAFLEGRLTARDLEYFRREVSAGPDDARGLCSYPHPWLMPDFWQFPTGSMGIGPINSIYQARFLRYLQHRDLLTTDQRRVWGFFGDGEMDEPESLASLGFAARERLDNLTWVINCNLQRLDGPVRGNSRIIDELESIFTGAGWHVVKLLWGSDWDRLFARDRDGALVRALADTVDGELQTLAANGGRYNRHRFFEKNESLRALARELTDDEIDALKRGGHDLVKIYAAFELAVKHRGRPSVVLAQTKKGYGMGDAGQGRMTTHQQKKLDREALLAFRDRFGLPLSDEQTEHLEFYKPAEGSDELVYLRERRLRLGGYLPSRSVSAETLAVPELSSYAGFVRDDSGREMSTTMAFVRMLSRLLKDKVLGKRIVPIVADEARTFGMASLFRQFGIYACDGQKYEPEDAGTIVTYREATDGQILEEGINEAGAMSSWVAAATSYSTHGFAMLPFYTFYSMFGFQRVGDLIWAAADQRARGFLLGATAGRTTLSGEGLQHQDGSSHVVAASIPNCRAYDPAFAGELAVILEHGMRQMLERQEDVFYYVTLMNESYAQPALDDQAIEGIIKGLYLYRTQPCANPRARVRLLGSGAILPEVEAASKLLAEDWCIESEIWSVTSFSELAREARGVERWNRLHPSERARQSHLAASLDGDTPILAATDYVRALPQSISPYVAAPYCALGTDGFGRSDVRREVRGFFEVDRRHVTLGALSLLRRSGSVAERDCADAIGKYGIAVDSPHPWDA